MKKIFLISGIAIIFGMILALYPEWFKFLWGWQILLLPLTAGILMVLAQDENRSYGFMPKLIVGSFLTSFVFVFWWWALNYSRNGYFHIPETSYQAMFFTALFFSGLCIFGGLVGIVIKGITLLNKK